MSHDVMYDLFRKIPFQVGKKFKYDNKRKNIRNDQRRSAAE